jgi:hypothetical protein
MPGYNELASQIQVLRLDVAKFYRVVLHSHSLDSKKDYGRSIFRNETISAFQTEEAYRHAITESNLDLIAITDHMKCHLACAISEEANKRGQCILPGMEVSLRPKAPWDSFKVHIVTIFPECYALDQISRMLPGQMPPEKDRTGDEEILDTDIPGFIEKVHGCGGICIAAHIDSKNGVRKTFRQLGKDGIIFSAADEKLSAEDQKEISLKSKEFLLKAGFDAIEVADVKDKAHYRWVVDDGRISIPALLTNDSHCPEDLEVEDRYTYIKMTNPCFDDLKLALKFADTRIRFPSDVPSAPSPRILGIQIASAGDKGFFKSIEICFSDNLSCFIGPRGSGKSALIESLRYVFGLNRMLKQLDPSGTDLAKKVRDLQAATLTNCIIRVLYCRKDGQVNVLESAFDAKQDYTTRVFDLEGNELGVHDVYATSDYPLRLFGWSEIETLGREPERQRDLLDRIIPEFNPLTDTRAKCRDSLVRIKHEIESSINRLFAILSKNGGEVKRFKEYHADFARLNTPEIDKLFVDIDAARAQTVILNQVAGNLTQWKQQLVNNSDHDVFGGVNELLAQSPQSVLDWWAVIPQTLPINEGIANVKSAVLVAVEELSRLETNVNTSLTSVNQLLQQKVKDLRERVGQEATQQVAVELRKTAAERLDVTRTRTEYNQEWAILQGHLDKWKEGAGFLLMAQAAVSAARDKQKKEIESKLNRYATPEIIYRMTNKYEMVVSYCSP